MLRRHFVALLATVFFSRANATSTDSVDPLPPWNYEELITGATRGFSPSQVKSVRLLAWHTQEDGRPLRYDAALLWMHLAPPLAPEKWALVIMARHPLDPPPSGGWVMAYAGHSWSPLAFFDEPPRNKQVYDFIEGHWEFEPDRSMREGTKLIDGQWHPVRWAGFRILASAVRARTWREVIGQAPVRFHRGEKQSRK